MSITAKKLAAPVLAEPQHMRLLFVHVLLMSYVVSFTLESQEVPMSMPKPGERTIRIPTIDISGETDRHVIIAAGSEETYQGHPTTLLLPDGRTMFCVWTINHGGPCGPLKRSEDGGRSWSGLLPVPANWSRVRNCPTLFRLPDPQGRSRLFVFAGQGPDGTMHQSVSEDEGRSWTPMESNHLRCVMPFCAVIPIDGGRRLLGMTNIRRPGDTVEKRSNVVAQSMSADGGRTWSDWRVVADIPGCKVCEPHLVQSPDGGQWLCLLRENNRALNSWAMVSDDEGQSWSDPRQLPAAVSGDRHMAAYAPDGRLVVCFRDTAARSATKNDFVAWIGTYEDLVEGSEGRYRVKLLHSHAGPDCGYPGLECLPDGTFVATTYIKYAPGPNQHSVVSVRFTLDELADRIKAGTYFVSPMQQQGERLAAPNLATKAKVTSSSDFQKGYYPAAYATDGRISLAGRWISGAGDHHWLKLTWPEEKALNRVRIWTGYTGRPELRINDYTIEIRNQDSWQVVATVTDNDQAGPEACNDLRFPTVSTKELRMVITRTPNGHARVMEIEAYGPDTPAGKADAASVPLNAGPHLFLDDSLLRERRDATRTIHACTKLPDPVLETEMAWEGDTLDRRVYVYGTVLRDRSTGRFRMWYNRMAHVLYATSADGVHWERPRLGLVNWRGSLDNNILPVKLHSPSVIQDDNDPDPAGRFKMLGFMGGQGYGAAHSADGLKWTLYDRNPVLPHGDTCTLAQDPRSGEYLAFHKIHSTHRGHGRRLVYLATSRDMQEWSEPHLVMAPDAIDDAQTVAEGGKWSEFYNLSAFPYGDRFLGFVTHFRFSGKPPAAGPGQSPDDGPIDVQLVYSRDGRSWERLRERSPVIPNGPHAYDAGCILGVANQPVIVDDEMWVYYTAITTTHGGFLPEKRITIARAAWRLDGFVSLDAGDRQGVIETVLLSPVGNRLTVNADAANGELRVEVLDRDRRVLPGYSAGESIPLQDDSVRHRVRWQAHERLPEGVPIALRFLFRNTSLYSFGIHSVRTRS